MIIHVHYTHVEILPPTKHCYIDNTPNEFIIDGKTIVQNMLICHHNNYEQIKFLDSQNATKL